MERIFRYWETEDLLDALAEIEAKLKTASLGDAVELTPVVHLIKEELGKRQELSARERLRIWKIWDNVPGKVVPDYIMKQAEKDVDRELKREKKYGHK